MTLTAFKFVSVGLARTSRSRTKAHAPTPFRPAMSPSRSATGNKGVLRLSARYVNDTHTPLQTHLEAHAHAHTQAQVHTRTRTPTHGKCPARRNLIGARVRTHIRIRTRIRTRTGIRTRTRTHEPSYTHIEVGHYHRDCDRIQLTITQHSLDRWVFSRTLVSTQLRCAGQVHLFD